MRTCTRYLCRRRGGATIFISLGAGTCSTSPRSSILPPKTSRPSRAAPGATSPSCARRPTSGAFRVPSTSTCRRASCRRRRCHADTSYGAASRKEKLGYAAIVVDGECSDATKRSPIIVDEPLSFRFVVGGLMPGFVSFRFVSFRFWSFILLIYTQ